MHISCARGLREASTATGGRKIQGWGGLTYRFETYSPHEQERCRIRSRYVGGTIATGVLDEIEDSCSHAGEKYAIKIRGTF